ncbi:MAG: TonB-dependent receptor [Caulobacterales bacterium]
MSRKSAWTVFSPIPCALSLVFVFEAAAWADTQGIVVTAERRDQSSNTASLDGAQIEQIGPQAPSEALNRLPGVAIHRNNGVENLPAIRSPVLTGGQSAGSFLMLEDGVPIRAAGMSNVNSVFETSIDFAERIEVTRGPGSALYGSNAVHGIVNVLTMAPGIRDYATMHSVEAGSFGRVSLAATRAFGTREGAVDDLQLGIVGVSATHSEGWRDDAQLEQQQAIFGFASYLGDWNLDSRLVVQNLNQQSAGFVQGPDVYDVSAIARSNPTPGAYRDQQLARARASFSRDFGDDAGVVITPYARWIDAALQQFFLPSRAREENSQWGAGVQSAVHWKPFETVSAIAGFDGEYAEGSLYEFQALATQPNGYAQGLHYDYDVGMTQLALYAQARWDFADKWALTGGLRGEQVRYDYDNRASAGDSGRFRRIADRSDDFSAVTPKLTLSYAPARDQTLWLNLARGSRPPQITDLYSLQTNQNVGEQGEENIDSVELGWRGALGAANIEIALYHMDKDGTSFRGANGFTVTNASSHHEGVEISASTPVTERFDLAGWVTYARHTYTFSNASEGVVSGNDADTAPRWIWNARGIFHATDALDAELEWVHMGEYFTDAANTRRYPGHNLLNLRLNYAVNHALTFFGAVRNLTNTDYADRADFAFGNDRYFPGEDRAFTIGVRAKH